MMKLISRRCLTAALGALTLLATPARAQVVDPSFAVLDARAASFNSKGNTVGGLAVDAAGRVLVGGTFDLLNGEVRGKFARLLASGQPDPSFGAGGVGANGSVRAIVPLPNGQYLIGGTFTRYDGQTAGRVARLNANGSLDATFNPGGLGADALVLSLAVDGQGRVLVGGMFHRFNGQPAAGLVRLSAAGVPDPTFSFTTSADENIVYTIVPDPAGKLLIGGYQYFEAPGVYPFDGMLYRLLPSGAIDPTFTDSLTPEDLVFRLALLPTGKVLIGGFLFTDNTYQSSRGVQRLNSDGSPDAGFVTLAPNGYVRDIAVLPNQQVLVVGSGLSQNGSPTKRVLRLQADGTLDPTFTAPTTSGGVNVVAAGPGASILLGGSFQQVGGQAIAGVARLTAAGPPDAGFTPSSFQAYATIAALGRQSGDQLVASGNFGTIGGTARPQLVRFTANGALDPSFQLDPAVATLMVSPPVISIGANDRVFTSADDHVYRLQPNGTRDASFDDGAGATGYNSSVNLQGVREQPDGRVLVWGFFKRFNGTPVASVVRLTASGAVDPTFTSPLDTAGYLTVTRVDLLPDGSVVLVENSDFVHWLDASGRPLPSFNGGQPLRLDSFFNVLALPDNTVLVSGSFTLNGTTYQGAHKLTAAGTVDPSFTLDASLVGGVTTVQANGTLLFRQSIYAGGPQLRRLLPTGAVDPSFAPVQFGTGYGGESDQAWVFQSTGDLVVGGAFTTVDGVQRPALARLTNIPLGRPEALAASDATWQLYPNPAHSTLTLRRATAERATATLLDMLGRPVRQWSLTVAEQQVSLADVAAGTYVVRIADPMGTTTRRVVVQP